MLPDRESNPGPLTYESGALPIVLCGPAYFVIKFVISGNGGITERTESYTTNCVKSKHII